MDRQRTKKSVKHEVDGDIGRDWCTWIGRQRFGKEAGSVGNRKTIRDYLNNGIVEANRNTEENRRDLRGLEKTCCLSEFSERLSANASGENSQEILIIIIIIITTYKRITRSRPEDQTS